MSHCGKLLFLMLTFIFWSCSSIKMITPEKTGLYDESFLQRIEVIKTTYKSGNTQEALKQLEDIKDSKLTGPEIALKYNFVGVINFSLKKFKEAKASFEHALKSVESDETLNSQIYLNLSSAEYKLGNSVSAVDSLRKVKTEALADAERAKYYQLGVILGPMVKDYRLTLESLIHVVGKKPDLKSLKSDSHFKKTGDTFFLLSDSEKSEFLEEHEGDKNLSVGYLAFLHAEKNFLAQNQSEAEKKVEWIEDHFTDFPDLIELARKFKTKATALAKIDGQAIGIIMPFSGEKAEFAQRAMAGIEFGLQDVFGGQAGAVLYTQDSKGNAVVGANGVAQLINDHSVSVIIGGLFSDEAAKEYLEAKRQGVFFISLSEVLLPKEEKDFLLLEIPGSVESQINVLMTHEAFQKFGRRGGILYPKTERGDAFTHELWREAGLQGVQVNGVQSYDKGATDFRGPVQELLGLRYRRERQEEADLWARVYSVEKAGPMRRVQTLPPKIDFDWLYIPAYPQEAVQIVPLFAYFDAFNLPLIGGPSWRSKSVTELTDRSGVIYLLGDELNEEKQEEFTKQFVSKYKRVPKLVETMSYEALKIIAEIFKHKISDREEMNDQIKSIGLLAGMTGTWSLVEGVWLKKMTPLKIKGGKVEKLVVETTN